MAYGLFFSIPKPNANAPTVAVNKLYTTILNRDPDSANRHFISLSSPSFKIDHRSF